MRLKHPMLKKPATPLKQVHTELLKDSGTALHTGKVARWAAVAASVVGISVGMVMPAHALNGARCEPETFNIAQGPRGDRATMCFANAGEALVGIADVHRLYSGNNAGYVFTNKGTFKFGKHQVVDFINTVGTVNIHFIRIN
jgi:Beta/Gamma crystallin